MAKSMTKGKCGICDGTYGKAAMTKHLQSCLQRKAAMETSEGELKLKKAMSYHLVVEGRYSPEYWMHLAVPLNATLKKLDDFLRNIWLECCGHLSAFTIEAKRYSVSPMQEYKEKGMKISVGNALKPGIKFFYEYDFGTTTDLALHVVSEMESYATGNAIRLLARNEPLSISCEKCGKPATQVCTQCIWNDEAWFCDECAMEHDCGEDMFLPVVNSPRVGMCAYSG